MTRVARFALLLVLLAAVVLPATAGRANAATLAVRAGTVNAQTLQRCQSSSVAVTATLRSPATAVASLSLTGLDATACAGRAVVVEVVDLSGSSWADAVQASGSGTVTGGSMTVSTSSFVPASDLVARVQVGGWTVPSTWTLVGGGGLRCVDASGAGRTCTVVVDRYTTWGGGYRLDFHVVTGSLLPFRYEVQADLSATGLTLGGGTGFPGWPVPASPGHPSWYPAGLSPTNACVVSTAAELPTIRLRGSGTGWNDYVAAWMPAYSLGFQVADSIGFPTGSACTY